MVFLILAILSSASIATLMRLSGDKVKHQMYMFFSNYVMCAGLSMLFGIGSGVHITGGLPLWLGMISGLMYLGSFVMMKLNIRRNGVVLSTIFMKLGVLVPTLMAVVIFGEQPSVAAIIGFVLAVAAMVWMNLGQGTQAKAGSGLLLVILLVSNGFTDSLTNIYDKVGSSSLKDVYLLFTFATAGVLSLLLAWKQNKKPSLCDVLWGLMIGVPNYFSSRFLLLALRDVPAMIVFPVFNIGVVLIISVIGVALFHERPGKRHIIGLAVMVAALLLLNM